MSYLETIVQEASAAFADKRIHLCDLSISKAGDTVMLSGTVLDRETITAVTNHLQTQLPNLPIDSSQVNVLRQSEATTAHISTTITTLYNEPGFLNEPTTQLLNGQTVECLQEKGVWAFVRQLDGYLGWIYRPYLEEALSQVGDHWVCEPVALLRSVPEDDAMLVSRVLGGTAVSFQNQQDNWANIRLTDGLNGWLPVSNLRPQNRQPQDETSLRAQMIADAYKLMGVPYLWGGSSAYGIDCSGFAQWVHRLSGMVLLRDADMQMENGRVVESSYQPGDLFFFGAPGGHRHVTHVGISLGGWDMIHASRSRNGVYVDNVQAVTHLRDSFLGAKTYIAPI